MPLILERAQVLDVYAAAAAKGWVLAAFNSENLTTTEAEEFGDVPVIVASPSPTGTDRRRSITRIAGIGGSGCDCFWPTCVD